MKSIKEICLVFVMSLLLLVAPQPVTAQLTTQEHEVSAAVSEFSRAFREADVSALKTFLTENYLHVNGRSGNVLNRDEWLNWVASRRTELDRGEFVINTYGVEDVKIQIYGEAAVVTGVVHTSGQRNETSFTSAGRFTNLWVNQGDVWRRAAFHDSPLPEPVF